MMESLPSTETKQTQPVEIKDKPKSIMLDFQDQIMQLVPYAGTIALTAEEKKVLYAPIDEEKVEIRPDGLAYLPWMEYVSILKDVFGMEWAIIPQGQPIKTGDLIIWGFWLIIRGKLCGFAYGEQLYQPSNATMTYGDALEGAKSNALMRLCKGIGISLELWRPSFVREWKQKYAESYYDNKKKRNLWRKKNQNEGVEENVSHLSQENPPNIQPPHSYPESETLTAECIQKFGTCNDSSELNSIAFLIKQYDEKFSPDHKALLRDAYKDAKKRIGKQNGD